MSKLERSDSGKGWAHGRVGNVVFLYYAAVVPPEALVRSFGLVDATYAKHPHGVALVAIFGSRSSVPPAAALKRVVSYLQQSPERLLIGCTVLEGTSIVAAMKRAAVNLVVSLAAPPYPHRILATPAMACDFVAPKAVDDSGAPLTQAALLVAVNGLRPPDVEVDDETDSAQL